MFHFVSGDGWSWHPFPYIPVSSEATFGRGDLSECPVGTLQGPRNTSFRSGGVSPWGPHRDKTPRALRLGGTSVTRWDDRVVLHTKTPWSKHLSSLDFLELPIYHVGNLLGSTIANCSVVVFSFGQHIARQNSQQWASAAKFQWASTGIVTTLWKMLLES